MLASRLASRRLSSSSALLRRSFSSALRPAPRLSHGPALAAAATAKPVSILARPMSSHHGESTVRPEPDKVLADIADYVHSYSIDSDLAWETARLCLIDTIGCGLEGLRFPECTKLLGPVVEGTIVPNGPSSYLHSSFTLIVTGSGQALRFSEPITSSIPFAALSILVRSFVGSISTTASWLLNVSCLRILSQLITDFHFRGTPF
jgi:hypothetical protein